MRTVWNDLRYGFTVLRNSPGFTVVAVLTLALGIAVNTTVFSWIDSVLLHPIPGAAADRELAIIETLTPNGEYIKTSYPDYRDYRDSLKLVSGMTAVFGSVLRIGEGQNGQQTWGELVTGNYFDVLGVRPALGRFFSREEAADPPEEHAVVVLSYRMWQLRYSGDPKVLGKTLRVNQRPLTIIGVTPPEFQGSMTGVAYDLWIPLTMVYQLNRSPVGLLGNRWTRNLEIFVRLKPGATVAEARLEAAARARELAKTYPASNKGISVAVLPISEIHMSGAQPLLRRPLQILMGVCALVLLIVCANVANLLLARSTARQREFAIRLALGADQGRLMRQLLTETFLLAGAGALVGMIFVLWLGPALEWLLPPVNIPIRLNSGFSPGVLAFTVLVCAAAAVISGLAPVLYSLRPNLSEALNEGGRGEKSGARSHHLRGVLVVVEVALASVALIGAALFVQSFRAARTIHPGFETSDVLVSRFNLAHTGQSLEQQHQFCLRLRQRLEAAPGVKAVTYADVAPLGFDTGPWQDIQVEGYVANPGENMKIYRSLIAPGYFNLLRIPLTEGRDFTDADDAKGAPVAIVNEAFARRFFAGANPVGRKVRAWGKWLTIVGRAKDAQYHNVASAPEPYFYTPYRQFFSTGLTTVFYLKTAGNPSTAIAMLRREAVRVDPDADVTEAMPLADYIASSLYPLRVAASLMTGLSALALLLAATGLYSVMAYAVSQRTRELGIRMALGAHSGDVLRMVLRQGMVMTGVGLAAGLTASLAVTRLLDGMLVRVSTADPLTFVGAGGFLVCISLLASYVPARRATRVDPMVALRQQ